MQLTKRPTIISVFCIIGYLWIIVSFPGIFAPSVKKMGDWFPAIYGLFTALTFISFIGVWHLKKWGVELFLITYILKVCTEIGAKAPDNISFATIFFPLLFLPVFIVYYKKMNANL